MLLMRVRVLQVVIWLWQLLRLLLLLLLLLLLPLRLHHARLLHVDAARGGQTSHFLSVGLLLCLLHLHDSLSADQMRGHLRTGRDTVVLRRRQPARSRQRLCASTRHLDRLRLLGGEVTERRGLRRWGQVRSGDVGREEWLLNLHRQSVA